MQSLFLQKFEGAMDTSGTGATAHIASIFPNNSCLLSQAGVVASRWRNTEMSLISKIQVILLRMLEV